MAVRVGLRLDLALALSFVVAGCGISATTAAPTATPRRESPSPTQVPQSSVEHPSSALPPKCEATIRATGLYEATISGEVIGAPRRNGSGGAGIDIDLFFEASSHGRTYPMLFSIWDPDSSAGSKGTLILFGPSDGSSILVDSGKAPEMGSATITDDGSEASFDVLLELGSKLDGSVECPVVE
jgi:hypothetical protein